MLPIYSGTLKRRQHALDILGGATLGAQNKKVEIAGPTPQHVERTQANFLAERTGMSATRLRAPLDLQGSEDELLRDFGAPGDASVAFTFDCESILACPG